MDTLSWGLNANQQAAIRERVFITSIAELRALPLPEVREHIRISLSPGGEIVRLRDNYLAAVTACHRGQPYDSDWLRFTGGAMHFFTQMGAVLPITFEAGVLPLVHEPPEEDEAALNMLMEVCCVDIEVARAALGRFGEQNALDRLLGGWRPAPAPPSMLPPAQLAATPTPPPPPAPLAMPPVPHRHQHRRTCRSPHRHLRRHPRRRLRRHHPRRHLRRRPPHLAWTVGSRLALHGRMRCWMPCRRWGRPVRALRHWCRQPT